MGEWTHQGSRFVYRHKSKVETDGKKKKKNSDFCWYSLAETSTLVQIFILANQENSQKPKKKKKMKSFKAQVFLTEL